MAYATKSIASRIDWCRRQSTQTCAQLERAGWQAEEEGLWDALFNRDHTTQYQKGPPAVFERYVTGLQDGQALLRTAAVSYHFAPPTRTATTGSNAGIDGMGDVSMRHLMGLTRRARKYLHESRVTGHHKK
jgi:hypothetical protein